MATETNREIEKLKREQERAKAEIRKQDEKIFFIEHGKLAKRNYRIAVVGIGNQAPHIIQNIPSLNTIPRVSDLYLVSSRPESDFTNLITTVGIGTDKGLIVPHHVQINHEKPQIISEHMNSWDITIFCLEPNRETKTTRADYIFKSAPAIAKYAKNFKDYKGSIILLTNPVDELAHIFAQESGLDPQQILGMSHVDTLRLKYLMRMEAYKAFNSHPSWNQIVKDLDVLNAYGIGSHTHAIPVIKNMMFTSPQIADQSLSSRELDEQASRISTFLQEMRKNFESQSNYHALDAQEKNKESKKLTQHQTEYSIRKTLEAIMNQEKGHTLQGVTGSVYWEKHGCFIGLPVDVVGPYFRPSPFFVDNLEDQLTDKNESDLMDAISSVKANLRRLENPSFMPDGPIIIKNIGKPKVNIEVLTRRQDLPKQTEVIVYGAGGQGKKIYTWDITGRLREDRPVTFSGAEKHASAVKVFNYNDNDYLAIGTSAGIILEGLTEQVRAELILKKPNGEIGHFIDFIVADDTLYARHHHLDLAKPTGRGLFYADLKRIFEKNDYNLKGQDDSATGPLVCVGNKIFYGVGSDLKVSDLSFTTSREVFKQSGSKAEITSLSSDATIVGYSDGSIVLLPDRVRIQAHKTGRAITAAERVKADGIGDLIFTGDKFGGLSCFDYTKDNSRIFGLYATQSGSNLAMDFAPVWEIRRLSANNSERLLVSCDHQVRSINLKEFNPTAPFSQVYSLLNNSISSIDYHVKEIG